MATSLSSVILDTPEAKIFELTVPQNDAIRTETVHTFAGLTMTNFNAVPREYFMVDVTPATANPTVTTTISISAISTLGFTTVATSVGGAAVNRTYRVYMHSRRFYQ